MPSARGTRRWEITDSIAKGFTTYGMQTFDQSLMQHVKNGLVEYESALTHSSNPDDFALRFKGISATSDGTWDDFESQEKEDDLDLVDGEEEPSAESLDDDLKIERF